MKERQTEQSYTSGEKSGTVFLFQVVFVEGLHCHRASGLAAFSHRHMQVGRYKHDSGLMTNESALLRWL
ncbi:hypothetical protein [Aureimonas sp. ME7]|uniref:hypothetical protein n=1 Tax=Aureimonas sp. ME7 TaxID=2744252 RepID=UPI0015F92A77|nr:hypothetical protein [Aureimonas sp. ME7]